MVNPFLPFVGLDTVRALVLYTVLRPGWNTSPTAINMWAEALKVAVSAVLLAYNNISLFPAESERSPGKMGIALKVLAFAAPAALFGANNILYSIGLQMTTPGRLATAMTARLPFSAALHHFAISPQRDFRAWCSLLALMLGLAISQYSPSRNASLHDPESMAEVAEQKGAFIGTVLGLTIAAISAIAGVTTEKILKDPNTPFWRSQLWLYWWGFVFAGGGALAWDGNVAVQKVSVTGPSASVSFALTMLCAGLSAATGLLAGAVLATLDIVMKLLGNALTLVTVSVGTALFFPNLETAKLSPFFVVGAGVILISSWHYAHWTGGLKGSTHSAYSEPTSTRTLVASITVIFMATIAASLQKGGIAAESVTM